MKKDQYGSIIVLLGVINFLSLSTFVFLHFDYQDLAKRQKEILIKIEKLMEKQE